MKANWKTTVFGLLTTLLTLAHASGVTVGHFGSTDFVTLGAAAAGAAFAIVSKDANQSTPQQ